MLPEKKPNAKAYGDIAKAVAGGSIPKIDCKSECQDNQDGDIVEQTAVDNISKIDCKSEYEDKQDGDVAEQAAVDNIPKTGCKSECQDKPYEVGIAISESDDTTDVTAPRNEPSDEKMIKKCVAASVLSKASPSFFHGDKYVEEGYHKKELFDEALYQPYFYPYSKVYFPSRAPIDTSFAALRKITEAYDEMHQPHISPYSKVYFPPRAPGDRSLSTLREVNESFEEMENLNTDENSAILEENDNMTTINENGMKKGANRNGGNSTATVSIDDISLKDPGIRNECCLSKSRAVHIRNEEFGLPLEDFADQFTGGNNTIINVADPNPVTLEDTNTTTVEDANPVTGHDTQTPHANSSSDAAFYLTMSFCLAAISVALIFFFLSRFVGESVKQVYISENSTYFPNDTDIGKSEIFDEIAAVNHTILG